MKAYKESLHVNIEIKVAWLANVFLFKGMLTPKIIAFVYWLALAASLAAGIAAIGQRSMGVWPGVGIMVGGPIIARIGCELLIVLFKVEEHLRQLLDEARN